MTEAIEVGGLIKRFGTVTAVDDLSFVVRPGRVTGFLGPNGAGKTTTLRMLLGLVSPTAGTATFGEKKYVDLSDPVRQVGAVLEASSAHRGRTGRNHLRMICRAAGLPDTRADEGGAAGRADQSQNAAQGGGLAGAVRADEAGERAVLHLEREVVDGQYAAEPLGQPAHRDRTHGFSFVASCEDEATVWSGGGPGRRPADGT